MRDPFPPNFQAPAASRLRSRIFPILLGLSAGLILTACSTRLSFETPGAGASEDQLAPPVYEGTVDYVDERLLTDQIETEDTNISQIDPIPPNASAELGEIDVADPCYGAKQRNEACSSVEVPLEQSAQGATTPAEIRLNSIGAGLEDPREFDADRTVDEIGRGQALSDTALAVGESFLSPPPVPVEPEPELEHPDVPDGGAVTYLNQ